MSQNFSALSCGPTAGKQTLPLGFGEAQRMTKKKTSSLREPVARASLMCTGAKFEELNLIESKPVYISMSTDGALSDL